MRYHEAQAEWGGQTELIGRAGMLTDGYASRQWNNLNGGRRKTVWKTRGGPSDPRNCNEPQGLRPSNGDKYICCSESMWGSPETTSPHKVCSPVSDKERNTSVVVSLFQWT